MAQNDPHVALIILTTHMWGKIFFVKRNFSGPKFVFRRLWWQHPSLHKTKGPARKPISGTPPPSFAGRPCLPPPPCKAIFGSPSLRDVPPAVHLGHIGLQDDARGALRCRGGARDHAALDAERQRERALNGLVVGLGHDNVDP